MARQSKPQKETVKRVMHEYKHGELKIRGNGPKVKNSRQAVAIALHEAGATNQESPKKNKENLHRTKQKEAKGQTAEAEREGKAAQQRTMKSAASGSGKSGSDDDARSTTKKALYEKAQRQHIPGRSKMSKSELAHAVHQAS